MAATDVEPDHVVTYMIFDAGCACQKPIVVEQRAWRGGSYHTRTTKFEYFADSKLLKKRTEINPATVPAPPAAEISWAANPLKARVAQQFL